MAASIALDRLDTLVIARMVTSARPAPARSRPIANDLRRFAPATIDDAAWRALVDTRVGGVTAEPAELVRRIGNHTAKTWAQLCDRVLPALALGTHAKIDGRDGWAAAIAARALGVWTDGPPPSLPALCDTFAWRQLGLPGKPKRCPDEIRALFIQRALATEPGPPDRLVRLYAAKHVEAPRAELRALRDALVCMWLCKRALGAQSFVDEVLDLARGARTGVFGDRKVFISSIWDELRRQPTWSALSLDDFKARLVRAHRDGEIVLARADLVGALPAELVAASETSTDGASFHFIVRQEPR